MYDTSRCGIVASATAWPVLTVLAPAAPAAAADPIFAALERWHAAVAAEATAFAAFDAAFSAFRNRHGALNTDGTQGQRQIADYDANVAPFEDATDAAADALFVATTTVFDTVPTTLGGLRAKIDHAFSADHVTELLLYNAEGDAVVRQFLDTIYRSACLLAA